MLGTPKGQGTGPCGRLLRKRKVTILGMQQWAISRKPKGFTFLSRILRDYTWSICGDQFRARNS